MRNTVVLIVLDGWGIGRDDASNPIHAVQPKTIAYIKNNFPSGSLQASGIAVGLPWGEEGNSEVGHLTMGIGKVVYQHFPRVSLSISDGTFQKNEALLGAFEHARKNNSRVHLMGLVGQANVHSSMEHLRELIKMLDGEKLPYIIHAFTDGRDSDPDSAYELLSKLPAERLGSVSGRYYAMDRDKHWDLTSRVYEVLTGAGKILPIADLQKHIQNTYSNRLNDEYIAPVIINSQDNAIKEQDAVICFNFREDRMRQIVEALVNPHFKEFETKKFTNVHIVSMTQYRDDFNIPTAFPPEKIDDCLGHVLSQNNKSQLRVAETQKYAHVTFFFNGLQDKPFPGEYRVLIPSKVIPRQEDDPVMMAPAIATRLTEALEENAFDFILVNFANSDMIAHTGNYEASEKAIQVVDEQLARIVQTALRTNATLLITADHGNVERLFNPVTGEPETKHDASPVPVYLVGNRFARPQNPFTVQEREKVTMGMLSDIAPTILELMDIQKPATMTGQSLLRYLV
ncbi:phosphoglycerate mutase (2,3-diphosphoglycerate-independent) [Candidatus Wolfebacteria bacterium RIFCSPHIGHO2_01_FULL_48_22]|uniref:2,3-bisphosphoglycerate-independent phosphoglycerate mutase n=2 Tax=Candidatus Wolfeibacteriota TaxID=1752735 RepID=A0A1F8DRV8_9BACT|nr:MAG: phosphoglycerate mutase (2,3-diphosphoglycerate-independent) [Candidatus Wolfebacteria bacterium RIFCSPHIGHO2_01_FULL_48_22]OGM92318.1 MAG: phosphoglycerate mutase (2,3-diphosphoglycerate-independent) [Candidatus Wolfebacteria bacterium RIFCSPLOWO2_01_FULL_47_17b]